MTSRDTLALSDKLRTPDRVCEPDSRNVVLGEPASSVLQRHYADIAQFALAPSVPVPVAEQFETAKNLYLYAWHVYRFFPVAESHALTTLEFGLRERLVDQAAPGSMEKQRGRPPTLSVLLRRAAELGLIRNEGFRRWHEAARLTAIERHHMDRLREMSSKNLDSVIVDDADAVVTPEDQNWDLVALLLQSLHSRRNVYAHGGPTLSRNVLGTFELVAEILNQVFAGQIQED